MPSQRNYALTLKSLITTLMIAVLGAGLAWGMNRGVQKLPIRRYFTDTQTNAVWDWSNITNHTAQDLQDKAVFLSLHQINKVFVDINSYVAISQNQDLYAKTDEEAKLTKSVENYVSAMNKRGIKVFVSAGDTEWSKPENQAIPLAIQQFAFAYNRSHPVKLAGVEFDIESYNQPHFAAASFTEKELVLNEYLDMVDRLATAQSTYIKESGDKNMELGLAIPYWYDNENHNIRSVSWHDKTGPVLFHVLDRLNVLPRSNVVVMAYRNSASGNDGMVYHSRTEVEYAASKAQNVNILIGLEVNNVEPAKITFYGQSYTEISSQVKVLDTEFKDKKVFKGIAINDLSGYQAVNANTSKTL